MSTAKSIENAWKGLVAAWYIDKRVWKKRCGLFEVVLAKSEAGEAFEVSIISHGDNVVLFQVLDSTEAGTAKKEADSVLLSFLSKGVEVLSGVPSKEVPQSQEIRLTHLMYNSGENRMYGLDESGIMYFKYHDVWVKCSMRAAP